MVRGMKYQITEVQGLYYLCSENKGYAYAKSRFSHDLAQLEGVSGYEDGFMLFLKRTKVSKRLLSMLYNRQTGPM